MKNKLPDLIAFCTIVIWGLTFISTKILLEKWTPLEILVIRFLLGWLALQFCARSSIKLINGKYEILFMLGGLTGVTLYFLLENIALTYTLASNVSVIVSATPFFTGLLAWPILKTCPPTLNFYIGFLMAICGIYLVSFGSSLIVFKPAGDMLALLAAIAWAFYSIITRKLTNAGFNSLEATRRIFFYGLVFLIPLCLYEKISFKPDLFIKPFYLGNFLFLGLGASALCFVSWTWCVKRLGTTRASAWIYLVPVITVVCAHIILHEKISSGAIFGIFLTLAGLSISESNRWKKAE